MTPEANQNICLPNNAKLAGRIFHHHTVSKDFTDRTSSGNSGFTMEHMAFQMRMQTPCLYGVITLT